MNPNELRIGNIINKGKVLAIKLDGITIGTHYEAGPRSTYDSDYEAILVEKLYKFEDCEPIPITEKILRVLGAKFTGKNCFILIPNLKAELHFEIFDKEIVTTLKSDFFELILDDLKYAHRLQNLHFSLTNRELAE